ncbi:hypothetical protein ZHAS_00014820 [Anopheles sinensis]|uniref:Uncharacterized protein n=1 Tax=Anopheles sinensis TaxID=74873 RepID=A0A084W9B9_ANOSI|nr:hypothetical protein ZHAS_00014820 [Anopheles sinensis]
MHCNQQRPAAGVQEKISLVCPDSVSVRLSGRIWLANNPSENRLKQRNLILGSLGVLLAFIRGCFRKILPPQDGHFESVFEVRDDGHLLSFATGSVLERFGTRCIPSILVLVLMETHESHFPAGKRKVPGKP